MSHYRYCMYCMCVITMTIIIVCAIFQLTDSSLFFFSFAINYLEHHFLNCLYKSLEDHVFFKNIFSFLTWHRPTCCNSRSRQLPCLSQSWLQQSRCIRYHLDQAVYLFHSTIESNQPAFLDTKQTPALPAKRTPMRDYQKDAVSSPAYYFQFLLEKVNLMSIIGS